MTKNNRFLYKNFDILAVVMICGGKESDLDTDERLKQENKDLGLCELLYNFGRYLVISASREGSQATNLQGIWNESYYAPWSSNYTLNINAEMIKKAKTAKSADELLKLYRRVAK